MWRRFKDPGRFEAKKLNPMFNILTEERASIEILLAYVTGSELSL